jgi:hypothetical protein
VSIGAIPFAESNRQIQSLLWRVAAKLSIVRAGNDPARRESAAALTHSLQATTGG